MSHSELVAYVLPPVPAPPALGPADLLAHWLAGRSPRTRRAYLADLRDFAKFVSLEPGTTVDEVVRWLLSLGPGAANANALMYSNHLVSDRKLAPATVARRLAALRSVVALANVLGMVTWSLGIQSPRVEARRDSRGPDVADRKRLWRYLRALPDTRRNRRDRALVALLFDLGLRRGEVAALELADFDQVEGVVLVVGKGRRERERITLTPSARADLGAWVEVRLEGARASLFGVTPETIYNACRRLGRAAGLPRPLRPHGLRHAAITAALDSGSDIRKVRKFSRHAKLETVIRYDDAREDTAGEVARRVSRERK